MKIISIIFVATLLTGLLTAQAFASPVQFSDSRAASQGNLTRDALTASTGIADMGRPIDLSHGLLPALGLDNSGKTFIGGSTGNFNPQRVTGGHGKGNTMSIPGDESLAAVPEPASLFLLGSGLLGAAALVRRRRRMRG
jgi:hypothetical protein